MTVERLDGQLNWFRITGSAAGAFLLERTDGRSWWTAATTDMRWAHATTVDWAYQIPNDAHEVHGWEDGLRWRKANRHSNLFWINVTLLGLVVLALAVAVVLAISA